MTLDIIRTDVFDDDVVRDLWALIDEIQAHDAPDLPPIEFALFAASLRAPSESERAMRWTARQDGTVVGHAGMFLPLRDNLDVAEVRVRVRPSARRRGIGRQLLDTVKAAAAAEGRHQLIGPTQAQLPGGVDRPGDGGPWALAMGASPALTEIARRLDTATVDDDRLATVHAEAAQAATGYTVVMWSGAAPDEYVDDLAMLEARMIADAPVGDLPLEPELIDAARWRETERRHAETGLHTFVAAARHDATDRIVGFTALGVRGSGDATCADQFSTLVHPDHRGHRLGLLLKAANLIRMRATQPDVRAVYTDNAASNEYMIAINDILGFRPHAADIEWHLQI